MSQLQLIDAIKFINWCNEVVFNIALQQGGKSLDEAKSVILATCRPQDFAKWFDSGKTSSEAATIIVNNYSLIQNM